MRLDKFLVITRLLKQRTRAKDFCDGGHVKVDGKTAKPSQEIKIGQIMDITLPRRRLRLRVAAVPTGKSVPKGDAVSYYEILAEETIGNRLDGPSEIVPRGD